jgi:hypothetical protein
VLEAYGQSTPPAFVDVAVSREGGAWCSTDRLLSAIREANAKAPAAKQLDLTALDGGLRGHDAAEVRFVVTGPRKRLVPAGYASGGSGG